jgi:hypothetical protein
MSDLHVIPDAEELLSVFLKAQPEMAGVAVFRNLPAGDKYHLLPIVRIYRWAGIPVVGEPLWADAALLQIDVWAGSQSAAFSTASTVRALATARLIGVHPQGVVSRVEFGLFRYLADPTFTAPDRRTAIARYRFDTTITVHP